MVEEGLLITIGAKVDGAVAGIKSTNAALSDMGKQSTRSADIFGKAFGAIRTAANILPGLGLGGAFLLIGEAVIAVVEKLNLFNVTLSNSEKNQAAFNAEVSKSEGKALGEVASITALVGAINNETLSREQRLSALQKLQKEYPAYFASVGTDINNTDALKKATDNLTAALIRRSKAQAYQSLITKAQEDLIKEQNSTITDNVSKWDVFTGLLKAAATGGGVAAAGINITGSAFKNQSDQVKELNDKINLYQKGLNDVTTEQIKFGDNLDHTTTKVKAHHEHLKKVKDVLDSFKKVGTIDNLYAKEPGDTTTPIANALKDSSGTYILKEINQLQDEGLKKIAQYKDAVVNLGQSVTGVFEGVFSDLMKGGGNALKIIGQFISQVIAKLLAAAAVALILSVLTGGTGAAAKGGGFMSLFKQLSGIPKLASGGITNGPQIAMIGDNASGREAVIPLERMGELFGNMQGTGGSLETRVSGDDLIFVLNRANARQGRSFGRG